MRPDELRTVGVVVGVHGLQGTLRVAPLSDFPERFAALHRVYLVRDEIAVGTYDVKRVKWLNDVVLITLRDVTKREEAENLRGAEICVPESERWVLPQDVYYSADLIGFSVVGDDGVKVGSLTGVLEGAQDTLIIETPNGELLVPFVHAWVGEVNTERRTIEVLNWRRLSAAEELPPSSDDDDH